MASSSACGRRSAAGRSPSPSCALATSRRSSLSSSSTSRSKHVPSLPFLFLFSFCLDLYLFFAFFPVAMLFASQHTCSVLSIRKRFLNVRRTEYRDESTLNVYPYALCSNATWRFIWRMRKRKRQYVRYVRCPFRSPASTSAASVSPTRTSWPSRCATATHAVVRVEKLIYIHLYQYTDSVYLVLLSFHIFCI